MLIIEDQERKKIAKACFVISMTQKNPDLSTINSHCSMVFPEAQSKLRRKFHPPCKCDRTLTCPFPGHFCNQPFPHLPYVCTWPAFLYFFQLSVKSLSQEKILVIINPSLYLLKLCFHLTWICYCDLSFAVRCEPWIGFCKVGDGNGSNFASRKFRESRQCLISLKSEAPSPNTTKRKAPILTILHIVSEAIF